MTEVNLDLLAIMSTPPREEIASLSLILHLKDTAMACLFGGSVHLDSNSLVRSSRVGLTLRVLSFNLIELNIFESSVMCYVYLLSSTQCLPPPL
jgi:hypothetical protein